VNETMIACDGLVHIYRSAKVEAVALQGLDLTVRRGEFVAIVGRSGSGKTTLLKILGGHDRPSAGEVRVAGFDLARLPAGQTESFRRRVGHVLQAPMENLDPLLSAEENVELSLRARAVPRSKRASTVSRFVEAFGLERVRRVTPSGLSGGEQQRVALAAALAPGPELLLADEPTAEMDSDGARETLEQLGRLRREFGTTVVMVTHDAEAHRYVDRVINIRDGRTSTERRSRREELIVMDRVGRLQLPEALVRELGLVGRVRVRREAEHIVIERAEGDADA
jgi:putative ABC transport system ATP-binding protein